MTDLRRTKGGFSALIAAGSAVLPTNRLCYHPRQIFQHRSAPDPRRPPSRCSGNIPSTLETHGEQAARSWPASVIFPARRIKTREPADPGAQDRAPRAVRGTRAVQGRRQRQAHVLPGERCPRAVEGRSLRHRCCVAARPRPEIPSLLSRRDATRARRVRTRRIHRHRQRHARHDADLGPDRFLRSRRAERRQRAGARRATTG